MQMRKTPRAAREGRRGSDRAAPWGAEINLDLCYLPSSSSSPKSSRMGTRKSAPRRASRSTELRGQSRLSRAWPSRRNWWNWCWEGAGCPAGSVSQTPPGETPGRGNCGTPLARPAAPSPAPGRSLRCRPQQHPHKSSFPPARSSLEKRRGQTLAMGFCRGQSPSPASPCAKRRPSHLCQRPHRPIPASRQPFQGKNPLDTVRRRRAAAHPRYHKKAKQRQSWGFFCGG